MAATGQRPRSNRPKIEAPKIEAPKIDSAQDRSTQPDESALCSEGMPISRRQGEDRVLTVPNALTGLRLACVPVFLVLLAQPDHEGQLAAAGLLAGLGITDGLDGYVARHFDQVTSLGKVGDPLVDRVLVLSATIGALAVGAVPGWLVALVLAREVLVLAGAGILALAGARRLDVSWAGKAGTFGLMFALPLFLMGGAPFRWSGTAETLAWVAATCGLGLGWFAVRRLRSPGARCFVEARAGRKTGAVVGPSQQWPRSSKRSRHKGRAHEGRDNGGRRGDTAAPAYLQPTQANDPDGQQGLDGARCGAAASPWVQ